MGFMLFYRGVLFRERVISLTTTYWDQLWGQGRPLPVAEPWLAPHLALLRQAGVTRILEVGCGGGTDSQYLLEAGFAVTATDYTPAAVARTRTTAPGAQVLQHDSREPFPFADGSFGAVVASLSLHYFNAATTRAIVEELARLLQPTGLLLFRLNSASDSWAGAPAREQERYYYSEAMCRELFSGWEWLALTEKHVEYLAKPKVLWEGAVRKGPPSDRILSL